MVFQKDDLVCSVNGIIGSCIVVFKVMKKQSGLINIKAEDGDVIYKTAKLNKPPGACRGVDDKHSIEHCKETFDLKFN